MTSLNITFNLIQLVLSTPPTISPQNQTQNTPSQNQNQLHTPTTTAGLLAARLVPHTSLGRASNGDRHRRP